MVERMEIEDEQDGEAGDPESAPPSILSDRERHREKRKDEDDERAREAGVKLGAALGRRETCSRSAGAGKLGQGELPRVASAASLRRPGQRRLEADGPESHS